jgi:ankyrin repeat protein
LLEKAAGIGVDNRNPFGTALVAAAARGHRQTVKVLLERGAYIDYLCQKDGWTALNLPAGYGHKAVVKLLINEYATRCAHDTERLEGAAGFSSGIVPPLFSRSLTTS